jgi:2'-5' RNA ligase
LSVRAFVAVELPGEARKRLGELVNELRGALGAGIRWVEPSDVHLTLKFLGDVPDARVDELIAQCQARARATAPFDVALAGLGAFPSARQARVLWTGVTDGARELGRLARKLDSACARCGVERERRPYQPHLTLGRLRAPRALAIAGLEGPKGIAFHVDDVVFYASRLSPRGAVHTPLARLALGAPEGEDSLDFAPDS